MPTSALPKIQPASDSIELASSPKSDDGVVEEVDMSLSEDGEIDEHAPEATVTEDHNDAAVDAMVEADLAAGGRDIKQKDARYFMMDNVVCNHCGTKGHLSYDCPEEVESARCWICGKPGHASRDCPDETCFYCKKPGHKLRECPEKAGRGPARRKRVLRDIRPPRPPTLSCYVCGGTGHLDCGLVKQPAGTLSCYNCGMTGHAGAGCHMTSVDRVVPIVMEMERERKMARQRGGGRSGMGRGGRGGLRRGGGREGRGDWGGGTGERGSGGDSDMKKMTPHEYREAFLERARQRRYGRGER